MYLNIDLVLFDVVVDRQVIKFLIIPKQFVY